jgi:uncharacterized membrane protein
MLNSLNAEHLHLLLNHFPTVGYAVGLGLFLVALFQKSSELKQASLVIFIVIALISIPTYLSGNAANFALKGKAELSESMLQAHQDAALLGLIFMELTGLFAWLEIWRIRYVARPMNWNLMVVIVMSLATFGLMARAANIGGELRHPEIRPATESSVWPQTAVMAKAFVIENPWVWPAAEIFHFIGLTMIFGTVLLVNLRLLGIINHVSFDSVYRLLPWGIAGFIINFISGMLFFVAVPDQYTQNSGFARKMVLLVMAAVTMIYPTVFDRLSDLKAEDTAPVQNKVIAGASIALWVAVIFFGRYLPYIGSE